jgi:fibronectin-binding protein A (FbpA)/ribosomal quality control pathway NFACT family protein
MDAVTLDRLIAEIAPSRAGRHVRRVRSAGGHALLLGFERATLWLDTGRETAGLYLLDRAPTERLRALAPGEPDAASRQALLHFGKHVAGARVDGLHRVDGERVVRIDAGEATVVLRLARPAAVTLAVAGQPVAAFGGPLAWPPPEPQPRRAWPSLTPDEVARLASGPRPVASLLDACPELGPVLAARVAHAPDEWPAVRAALADPRPYLCLPAPDADDVERARAGAVGFAPLPLAGAVAAGSFAEAAASFLEARLRGDAFTAGRKAALDGARASVRRAAQLERHLEQDLAGLAAEEPLRRQAEALLASPAAVPPGADAIEVADPYDPARSLRVRVDPRLSVPANADRLFEKARRVSRARGQIAERLAAASAAAAGARATEERVLAARNLADLPDAAPRAPDQRPDEGGPRRFLTARGVMMLVGRGARENHRLTFQVARPEDLWLHARDSAGAHVILRDPEGRAGAADVREAAEVAAFYSRARADGQVDVHVTRRKHVQPSGGGAGRVRVVHSETVRVAPRDPEGRLRAR